ncbi:Lrp/AsnC family transcriptional regulator [Acinetobacter sp. HY1485]|uniref:Lrp/AsnC family transcriptional regulator n=1 Tax=Acinetobacter sp. HY1485 TaxID=2970918 RepID=UPI003FA46594
MSKLDAIDYQILNLLQQNARLTNQNIADKVHLSASPCWRKIKKLEDMAIIEGYGVRLNRKKLGLGVMVFVKVVIDHHSEEEAKKFEQEVECLDHVIACYSIGGDADFLLQVVAKDLDEYAHFSMNVIRRLSGIKEMQSMFVLKEIKKFNGFPIG